MPLRLLVMADLDAAHADAHAGGPQDGFHARLFNNPLRVVSPAELAANPMGVR